MAEDPEKILLSAISDFKRVEAKVNYALDLIGQMLEPLPPPPAQPVLAATLTVLPPPPSPYALAHQVPPPTQPVYAGQQTSVGQTEVPTTSAAPPYGPSMQCRSTTRYLRIKEVSITAEDMLKEDVPVRIGPVDALETTIMKINKLLEFYTK